MNVIFVEAFLCLHAVEMYCMSMILDELSSFFRCLVDP